MSASCRDYLRRDAILSTNSARFSVYGGHLTIRSCASLLEASSPHEPAFVCVVFGPAPKAPRETVDAPSALFATSVLYLHINITRAFEPIRPLHTSSVNEHPNAVRSCTSASRHVHTHRSDLDKKTAQHALGSVQRLQASPFSSLALVQPPCPWGTPGDTSCCSLNLCKTMSITKP